METLVDHLADAEPTLVLLDNCEHVADASAEITERLVRCCPAVQVLATSRWAGR